MFKIELAFLISELVKFFSSDSAKIALAAPTIAVVNGSVGSTTKSYVIIIINKIKIQHEKKHSKGSKK